MNSARMLLLALAALAWFAAPALAQTDSFNATPPTADDRPAAPEPVAPREAQVRWDGPTPEVGAEGDFVFTFPSDASVASVEVKTTQESKTLFWQKDDAYRDGEEWRLPVALLVSGERALGPFDLRVRSQTGIRSNFETPALMLDVAAPTIEDADDKDFLGVLDAPLNLARMALLAFIGLVVIAAIAGLAVLLALWLRKRGRKTAPFVAGGRPALPPLQEAEQALRELATLGVFNESGARVHYADLSFLLRRYFERAHRFPALEMTEDEMDERLRLRFTANAAAQGLLSVFANASMAKFAKWTPKEETVRADLAAAEAWIAAERERERQARLAAQQQATTQRRAAA